MLKQFVVIGQLVTKQRKALNKGTTPRCDLNPTIGQGVNCCKALVDPNWVLARQDRHAGSQGDVAGGCGKTSQNCVGGGNRKIIAVVLTDVEVIQPKPISQLTLSQNVSNYLSRRLRLPAVIE